MARSFRPRVLVTTDDNARNHCRYRPLAHKYPESAAARLAIFLSFRKKERAKEGAKAMMEYQANARMVREKTERLKALRLAREAADKGRAG